MQSMQTAAEAYVAEPVPASPATPLPAALKGDKSHLSQAALDQIAALNGAAPVAFTGKLVGAWLTIAAAWAAAIASGSPWIYAAAVFVVASRMNVLGLLVHDQAHLSGYRGRWGDTLVNVFAGYPLLGITVETYAQIHLSHHRDYFGPTDPDFARKSGPDWTFPMPASRLARLFIKDLVGLSVVSLFKGKAARVEYPEFKRPNATAKWVRPVFLLGLAVLLTVTQAWFYFAVLWLLPLLTVMSAIVRWGAICEHSYGHARASVESSTPLIMPGFFGRLLLPNLNFSLHPYHHWHPGVPFSLLPKVHAIYQNEGLVNEQNVFRGYWSYMRYLTDTSRSQP